LNAEISSLKTISANVEEELKKTKEIIKNYQTENTTLKDKLNHYESQPSVKDITKKYEEEHSSFREQHNKKYVLLTNSYCFIGLKNYKRQ
jgi:predicted  nucleic acid-binding Zn-ribbon protein